MKNNLTYILAQRVDFCIILENPKTPHQFPPYLLSCLHPAIAPFSDQFPSFLETLT